VEIRAQDEALVIHNILEYYEVIDDLFAVCCDTTAINTGRKGGIKHILSQIFNKPLLWLLCRHHIYEVHVSHVMNALVGPSKGADRKIYKRFREQWEQYQDDVNKTENAQRFKKFDEKKLLDGSKLYHLYQESKSYIKYTLENEVFPRGVYCLLPQH
jgi:hypothetical protein